MCTTRIGRLNALLVEGLMEVTRRWLAGATGRRH
jgi:hypothetical protein